jgi:DNA-3-methyladenine glycosylase I
LYRDYHDKEWGVPIHDDRTQFEFLTLEGAQAGLSWGTILRKRESFRKAFDNFDPAKIARYNETKVRSLLSNPGIIRHELKIRSAIQNAGAFLAVRKEFGSFDSYVWRFVGNKPKIGGWRSVREIPATATRRGRDANTRSIPERGAGVERRGGDAREKLIERAALDHRSAGPALEGDVLLDDEPLIAAPDLLNEAQVAEVKGRAEAPIAVRKPSPELGRVRAAGE